MQRGIQALAQGFVVLAHSDGGIGLGVGHVAKDLAAIPAVLVHPLVQREFVGNHTVQAAGRQVCVGFVHGRVQFYVGTGLAIHVFGVDGLGGRRLRTDGVADKVGLGAVDLAVLGNRHGQWRAVVVVGEGDLLASLFGVDHRRHHGVILARHQGGDDAFPVLGHQRAFDFHLLAQGVGDVDIEAMQLVIGVYIVEGRVGTLGGEPQGFSAGGTRQQQGARTHQGHGLVHLAPHCTLAIVVCPSTTRCSRRIRYVERQLLPSVFQHPVRASCRPR